MNTVQYVISLAFASLSQREKLFSCLFESRLLSSLEGSPSCAQAVTEYRPLDFLLLSPSPIIMSVLPLLLLFALSLSSAQYGDWGAALGDEIETPLPEAAPPDPPSEVTVDPPVNPPPSLRPPVDVKPAIKDRPLGHPSFEIETRASPSFSFVSNAGGPSEEMTHGDSQRTLAGVDREMPRTDSGGNGCYLFACLWK